MTRQVPLSACRALTLAYLREAHTHMALFTRRGRHRKKSLIPGDTSSVRRTEHPTGMLALTESYAADYDTIYRTQPAVRIVVDAIARAAGNMSLKTYQRSGLDRQQLPTTNSIVALLANPNAASTGVEFVRDIWTDRLVHGNGYYLKLRDKGRIVSLVRVPPALITGIGELTETAEYRVMLPGGSQKFPASDFGRWTSYPGRDFRTGLSPLEAVRQILGEDDGASKARFRFWSRGASPASIITRPNDAPDWDDPARDRFIESLRKATSTGLPLLLEEGMTWTGVGFNAEQSQFVQARELSLNFVGLLYGVPPGLFATETRNLQELWRSFTRDMLAGYAAEFDASLNRDLVPELAPGQPIFVETDVASRLEGDFIIATESFAKSVGGPFMTVNEARQRLNLRAIPGGDSVYYPLNMQRGEAA